MANVGTAAAGKTLIGAGNGASPTFADIGTNSGLTTHGVVVSEGNSAFVSVTPGALGTVLTSNGVGIDPSFKPISSDGAVTQVTGNSGVATPSGGNLNVPGSGVVVTTGSGSTLTVYAPPGGLPVIPLTNPVNPNHSYIINNGGFLVDIDSSTAVTGDIIELHLFGAANSFAIRSADRFIVIGTVTVTNPNYFGVGDTGSFLRLMYNSDVLSWSSMCVIGDWFVV